MDPWHEYGRLAKPGKVVYLFTRTRDFNAPPTRRRLRDAMRAAGFVLEYLELPGGHSPLLPDEMIDAVRWMDARL